MPQSFKNNPESKSRFKILKNGKISLVVSALLGSVSVSVAAPSGGVVTSGNANIIQNGSVTNINQSSQKASINWRTFSIASGETVNFNQPNVNSITLNRIIGNEKSIINGALNANGQVWLLNSNGVLFGKNARVNTAGILATTKNLSDDDFNSGNYIFKGNSQESVINLGVIDITDSGYATLLANSVSNEGTIKAVRGKVHLVGAEEVSISLNGNSLVELTVKKGVLDALVENKGAIYAIGGEIYLTTNAVDELLKGVVNNTGIVEAQSFDDITGKIELFAHGGEVKVDGTLKAEGGFIETSGKEFKVSDNAIIKAKQWLIDPVDITIESTGSTSDLAGSSIKASFIESTLNSGTGVTLTATNDINVNENISWTDALFTLDATNDININAIMSASGTAGLTMNGNVLVGFNSGEASGFKGRVDLSIADIIINGNTYKVLTSLGSEGSTTTTDLQGMNGDLSVNYVLGKDIDASATSAWNTGEGFDSIGDDTTSFTGNFDGLGHTVTNLSINKPNVDYLGLFGYTDGNEIKNTGLENISIIGKNYIAGLVGQFDGDILRNNYVTGSVDGGLVDSSRGWQVGGMVGQLYSGNVVSNNYSTATVKGHYNVGGLFGSAYNSNVSNSYATGNITGKDNYVGGLIGSGDAISDSYATGNVTGNGGVGGLAGSSNKISTSNATGDVTATGSAWSGTGGLVGDIWQGEVLNSYATGKVTGLDKVGGLVGQLSAGYGSATVSNSYSTGAVKANDDAGGLVGTNDRGLIENSYASGSVTTDGSAGGLVSNNNGTIKSSYATGTVTAAGDYAGGLVGDNYDGVIKNSYATGAVTNTTHDENVGGLVAYHGGSNSIIENSYATGLLTGTGNNVGGLIGYNYGTVNNSYYDKTINSAMSDENNFGKATTDLKDINNFSDVGWDIEEDSSLSDSYLYPILTMNGSAPIWKIYVASNTTPISDPTPDPKAEKAITAITNKVSITAPVILKTSTQNFTTTKINFGNKTDKVTIVSKPRVGEKTKKVSQSEVKQMQGTDTTIVPIGRNALVQLIDSGVTLPEGVEQEFYVVDDKRR